MPYAPTHLLHIHYFPLTCSPPTFINRRKHFRCLSISPNSISASRFQIFSRSSRARRGSSSRISAVLIWVILVFQCHRNKHPSLMSTRGRPGSTRLPTSTPNGLKFKIEETEKVHRQLSSNRPEKKTESESDASCGFYCGRQDARPHLHEIPSTCLTMINWDITKDSNPKIFRQRSSSPGG